VDAASGECGALKPFPAMIRRASAGDVVIFVMTFCANLLLFFCEL
jgi:hypothetical protein